MKHNEPWSASPVAKTVRASLLRPVASRPPPGRRSGAPHAAAPGPAAARTTPANKGAVVRPNRGRGDRRAAARTQDLPAVSPRTADLHPHPCSGTGHGTVIRRPLTRRRPIPPPRAPARHSTGLTFMPPMAVAMTRTTPTAIPNASYEELCAPTEIVEGLRTLLKGGKVAPAGQETIVVRRALPHGHVAAVLGALRDIALDRLLGPAGSPPSRRPIIRASGSSSAATLISPASAPASARTCWPRPKRTSPSSPRRFGAPAACGGAWCTRWCKVCALVHLRNALLHHPIRGRPDPALRGAVRADRDRRRPAHAAQGRESRAGRSGDHRGAPGGAWCTRWCKVCALVHRKRFSDPTALTA